jgi:hypothetical protein
MKSIMKKRRKFDGIKFYRRAAAYIPDCPNGTGLYCINDQWLVDCVAINGAEVKCASVDIYEFEKMLQKSGKYQPFTDPEWVEGLEYSPVRSYVEDESIVMVMRTPLRIWEDEDPAYNAYRFRKCDIIEGIKNLRKTYEL